jgi:ribonuclease R
MDRDPALIAKYLEFVPMFETMRELFEILNERRRRRGSIDFDLKEPAIILDDEGMVKQIIAAERRVANRIIEEFMLVANETVAEHLDSHHVPTLYRIHESPDPLKVAQFEEFVSTLGYSLAAPPNEVQPRHFQKLVERIHGKPEEKPIAFLMLRTMQKARYAETNSGHFGLAAKSYTHFTSPIRRYPDLIAHRALLSVVGEGERPHSSADVGEAGPHCSELEREAMKLERQADDVCAAFLLERELYEEGRDTAFEGEVSGVIGAGAFIRFGGELAQVYEGFLPARRIGGRERYELDETETKLVGTHGGDAVRLGDPVTVTVDKVEAPRGRVDLVPHGD